MVPSILDAVISAISSAIGGYGQAVLTSTENAAAEGTMRLGHRLLARIRRKAVMQRLVDNAVLGVAAHPGDADFVATLRAQIRKAMEDDPGLEADLIALVKAGGVSVIASGDRAVAVQHNEGIISAGDHAVNRISRS